MKYAEILKKLSTSVLNLSENETDLTKTIKPTHLNRLWIYKSNYFQHVNSFLQEQFPVFTGHVGGKNFAFLSNQFLAENYILSENINELTTRFFDFVLELEQVRDDWFLQDLLKIDLLWNNPAIGSQVCHRGSLVAWQQISQENDYRPSEENEFEKIEAFQVRDEYFLKAIDI